MGQSQKCAKRQCRNSERLSWDQLQNVVTVREFGEVRVGTDVPAVDGFPIDETQSQTHVPTKTL